MLQQVRNQIVEKIVSDIGDRYPELPYGCLHVIADSELDKTLSSVEARAQKERTSIENLKSKERDAHWRAMQANMNEGY